MTTTFTKIKEAAGEVFGFSDVRECEREPGVIVLHLRDDETRGRPNVTFQAKCDSDDMAAKLDRHARRFATKLLTLADSLATIPQVSGCSRHAEAFAAIRAELSRRFNDERQCGAVFAPFDSEDDTFDLRLRRVFTDHTRGESNVVFEVASELRAFAAEIADAADALEESAGDRPGIEPRIIKTHDYTIRLAGIAEQDDMVNFLVQADSEAEALAAVRRMLAGVKACRMAEPPADVQPAA